MLSLALLDVAVTSVAMAVDVVSSKGLPSRPLFRCLE